MFFKVPLQKPRSKSGKKFRKERQERILRDDEIWETIILPSGDFKKVLRNREFKKAPRNES